MLSNLSLALGFQIGWILNLQNLNVQTATNFDSFLNSGVWGKTFGGQANFSIVNDPLQNPFNTFGLQINYPAGSYRAPGNTATNQTVMGGAQFFARPFPQSPAFRALLEYDLFFPPNFPFNLGGKLPGLYGTISGSNPSFACAGGIQSNGTNCWSTRYMWRSFGAGEVYAYLPPSAKSNICNTKTYPLNYCNDPEYGLDIGRTAFKFQTGVWNRLAMHVQVNQIGQSDGLVQVYLNDNKVVDVTGVTFRDSSVSGGSLLVTDIIFSSFFGGSTMAWASPTDTFAIFRNISLSITNEKSPQSNTSNANKLAVHGLFTTLMMVLFLF